MAQTTLLNTLTLSEMTDLTRREWAFTRKYLQRNAKQLFIFDPIPAGNGNSKIYNEVDIETYADWKAEGANASKSKVGVGYNVTMTARTFAKEVDITLEMRQYNRYQEVGAYITSLSEFCDNRQDLDLTHRITFGQATTYTDMNGQVVSITVGDGLALFHATHTLLFSATTYSNLVAPAAAFSTTALDTAKQLGATQIYTNFGQKRQMNFNTIFSGDDPTTVRAIREVLESTARVDAVNSGVANIYGGSMKHVILPNLATTAAGAYDSTKAHYWGIAATGQGPSGWQAYLGETIPPTLKVPSAGNNGEDVHNYNWTYSSYGAWGTAIVSGKGIILSPAP